MESIDVTDTFEAYMQELKRFQEKYPKAFKANSVVPPESSLSLFSSKERKELSKIYFHLAKATMKDDNVIEENRLQPLDYLNASISLDALCNKEAYSMIAKIYATKNNPISACSNALIAMVLGEISGEDKFLIQQCERMPFPIPQNIKKYNIGNIDFYKDVVLILEPGTYTAMMPIIDRNIVIIGIGEVKIKNSPRFGNTIFGADSKLILYNIHVECTHGHSLFFNTSQIFVENCWFTKCPGLQPPICIDGRNAKLSMNKCVVANSRNAGGILMDSDSEGIITNCKLHDIGMNSIEVRYGSSLYAEKNEIYHNKQGVVVWLDAKKVTLIDNVIRDCHTEGILVNGNREPELSKQLNKFMPSPLTNIPPPSSSYIKPPQTVAVLQKNRILNSGTFGVSTEFQAEVKMEENEVAFSGVSGCIIKGGSDASLFNNKIHHNKSNGLEIGINYHGKVVVENNYIHSNKKENILQPTAKMFRNINIKGVSRQKLFTPAKMINNRVGSDDSNEQSFIDFNVSSNRPGMHLFYEEAPFLYAIGNTYGFNLLKDFDTSATISTIKTTSQETNKIENKQVSVFLGGIGDLRNIVETVHDLTKSLENSARNYNIDLLFKINDFNPTILARDFVLLEMISKLPDPKSQPSTDKKGLYSQWNKNFVVGATEVLSVWAEKTISANTYNKLSECIHSLIESFENNVGTGNNNTASSKKLPSWISFKYSLSTASSILQTLKCWKTNLLTAEALNWNVKQSQIWKSFDFETPESERLKNLKKHCNVDEDTNKYTYCQLPISIQAQSCNEERENSEAKQNKVNVTMLTAPTMEYDVYPTSCIFRAFQVAFDPSKKHGDQPLTLYDHLLLTLIPKFISIRASLRRTSSVRMQVTPILGDTIDTLLCRLPSSVRFNAIDCSNLADYVSLLNILLTAAPRLESSNSLLMLQLMKLNKAPANMKEFVEERLGLSLYVLECLTGITFVNAYYQDYAVYVTWKFDIRCKEKKSVDTLIMDVISVASACCATHTNRIKGLSINTLVRLFQIMITRFSEKTMVELLRSLFASEGFEKHISNFAIHLVELKVFMTLHLSYSMITGLEEFDDLKVSIASYTVKWKTDKINSKNDTSMTKMVKIKNEKRVDSEAEIWLRLIKPTFNGGARKQKNKGKNSSHNQEPPYYYFDSISLSAIEAPLIAISFHLPVPFYDTHKGWILECKIGSEVILPAAKKLTLSEATQKSLHHDTWIDVSRTEDVSETKDNNDNETEKNDEECKRCGSTTKKIGGGICAKCKSVFYCSKDCQKEDWKRHKKEDCN